MTLDEQLAQKSAPADLDSLHRELAHLRRENADLRRRLEQMQSGPQTSDIVAVGSHPPHPSLSIDDAPIPMSVLRMSDGIILSANAACRQLLGWEARDLLGRPAFDLLASRGHRRPILKQVRAVGSLDNCEIQLETASGTPIWVRLSLRSLRWNGEPVLLGVFYEIGDRQTAEEKWQYRTPNLHRQCLTMEFLNTREHRNPERLTQTLREIAEAATEMLAVERVSVWLYKPARPVERMARFDLLPERGFCLGGYDRRPDRRYRVEMPPEPVPDSQTVRNVPISCGGEILGWLRVEVGVPDWELTFDRRIVLAFLVNLVALTLERFERRRVEATFSAFNEQLESRVEKRTAELRQAVRQLRSEMVERIKTESALETALCAAQIADRAKNTFLMNMSHELRTPLHAIIGYSDILIEEMADANRTEPIADLKIIRKAGYNLLSLIEDLLKLSQIEAGSLGLHPEIVEPGAVVRDVAASLAPLAEANRNHLELRIAADLEPMRADPQKLHQILHNLLGNALKFTENGRVTLTAGRESRPDGEWICFRVADTGIGLSAEQQRSLFEAFAQADESPSRRYGGGGLGLAIARHFSQMMGGEISVSSQLGLGSTFTLKLPAYPECDRFPAAIETESPRFGEIL